MTKRTIENSLEIGCTERATKIWVQSHGVDWMWQCATKGDVNYVDSHDPMDRVGGPYRISDVVNGSDGRRWFLFSVADCAFPCYDLVRADDWQDAYSRYIDWAADNRHILIDKAEYADFGLVDGKEATCEFTSDGQPVNTDNVNGSEVTLSRVDFL